MDENPFEMNHWMNDIQKSSNAKEFAEKMETKFKVETDSEIEMSETKDSSKSSRKSDQPKWMSDKYSRLLLTSFHDGNITEHNGEEVTAPPDVEMRNSILYGLYNNMACCYMKLKHWEMARQVLQEAKLLWGENSQYLYRMACSRACDKGSSLEELMIAKEEIMRAWEIKDNEKVFKNEKHVLDLINIGNYKEAYQEFMEFIDKRIIERTQYEEEKIGNVLDRCQDYHINELKAISLGRTPEEPKNAPGSWLIPGDELLEPTVMNTMVEKYATIIEYYLERNEKKVVKESYKEIVKYMDVYNDFFYYWNMDYENLNETQKNIFEKINKKYNIDFSDQKNKDRLERAAKEQARKIFESGKFNLDLFRHTVEDYFKKKMEREENERRQELIEQGCEYDSNGNPIDPLKKSNWGKFGTILTFGVVLATGYAITYGSPLLNIMSF